MVFVGFVWGGGVFGGFGFRGDASQGAVYQEKMIKELKMTWKHSFKGGGGKGERIPSENKRVRESLSNKGNGPCVPIRAANKGVPHVCSNGPS